MYQALHYVLLFPTAQFGWHPNIKFHNANSQDAPDLEQVDGRVAAVRRKQKTVSQIEYFAYQLHPRANESNYIFRAARLFQEYVVDLWASAEQSHLKWFCNNQNTICADLYCGLADTVAANPDVEGQDVGQHTILPPVPWFRIFRTLLPSIATLEVLISS
jgi:hypothetical protein